MNTLLPIIEILADAKCHADRAEWLLACPIAILRKYDMTIRNRLMHAECAGGLSYLEDLSTVLNATRDPQHGLLSSASHDILFLAGQRLLGWAANVDAYNAAAAGSEPTDL